jgi:MFS superfamily sulfate permease-like transporter
MAKQKEQNDLKTNSQARAAREKKSTLYRLPVLQGVLPIKGDQISAEIIAGLTLAAIAIPEVMGYTKIAGTPVITGLYTILIPMAIFALIRFFTTPCGWCRFSDGGHSCRRSCRARSHWFQ